MGESPAKDRRAQNDLSDSFWEDIRKYTIPNCKTVRSELWCSSEQFCTGITWQVEIMQVVVNLWESQWAPGRNEGWRQMKYASVQIPSLPTFLRSAKYNRDVCSCKKLLASLKPPNKRVKMEKIFVYIAVSLWVKKNINHKWMFLKISQSWKISLSRSVTAETICMLKRLPSKGVFSSLLFST